MNRLPKYWVVENDLTPKYKDIVIGYLNKECDVNYVGGSTRYYGYDGNEAGNGTNCDNLLKQFKNNPTLLTLDEFIELSKPIDEFILPEKWWVQSTMENYDVIYTWLRENKTNGNSYINLGTADKKSQICFPDYCNWHQCKGDSSYKEITFEQFQKYVLKLKDMEKKIVGYKLKEECQIYKEPALKICNTIANWENSLKPYDIDVYQKGYIDKLRNAGVLDLWFEPVYKEEYPNITINGYKGEFFDNYVKFGCAEIGKELFIRIYGTEKIHGNKDIESVTIGAGTFTKDQINQIAEYYLNKK